MEANDSLYKFLEESCLLAEEENGIPKRDQGDLRLLTTHRQSNTKTLQKKTYKP